ncbi:DUF6708 domain-containing protein, partial [Motilimonas sp. KMU-193]|uniref:DUF6708 domain-containing protein n=1 Tax=Motilimonas sp. KMU-193 TaxID=3388668 RepID=UPI00396B47DC
GRLKEDILSPPVKHVRLTDEDSDGTWAYKVAAINDTYMDFRHIGTTQRGLAFGMYVFLCVPAFLLLVAIRKFDWMLSNTGATEWFLAGLFLCWAISFLRPLQMPMRFNRAKQEVYIWHRFKLYRIPWAEFNISLLALQDHIGSGQLMRNCRQVVWLYGEHQVPPHPNRAAVALTLYNNSASCEEPVQMWNYINKYMTQGLGGVYNEPGEKHIDGRPRKGDSLLVQLRMYTIILLISPFMFIFFCPLMSIAYNPFRWRWPKQVHQWTGPNSKNYW